jgi:hypothetical protein
MITGNAEVHAFGGKQLGSPAGAGGGAGIGTGGTGSTTPPSTGMIVIDTTGAVTGQGGAGSTGISTPNIGGKGANIGAGGYRGTTTVAGDGYGINVVPKDPRDIVDPVVPPGGNVTLTCPATLKAAPFNAWQWQKGTTSGTPPVSTWANLADIAGKIAGATTTTLTLSGFTNTDAGKYRCVAKINDGTDDKFEYSEDGDNNNNDLKVDPKYDPELPTPDPDPLAPGTTTRFNLIVHPNPNNNTGFVDVTLPSGATLAASPALPAGCTTAVTAGITTFTCPLANLANSGSNGKTVAFSVVAGPAGVAERQLTVRLYGITGGTDIEYKVDPIYMVPAGAAAVPTLGELGLLMLALSVLGVAGMAHQRRRA